VSSSGARPLSEPARLAGAMTLRDGNWCDCASGLGRHEGGWLVRQGDTDRVDGGLRDRRGSRSGELGDWRADQ